MIFDIDAQIILGESIDLSPFVISYTRNQSMCNVSHIGEIKLAPNVNDFLEANEITIETYERLRIFEYGDQVMTGYVAKVVQARSPVSTVSIYFSDTFKRAKDYFIDDPNWETSGETLGDLFGQLCDLCGVSWAVDSADVGGTVLPPGQPLGLKTVASVLDELIAYASGVIFVDGHGVARLRRGARESPLQFTTGASLPTVDYSGWTNATLPTDLTHGNVFAGTVLDSDENTRDRVSVWGYPPPNPFLGTDPGRIVVTREVDLGLPVPKTAVYSSSLIQTYAEAARLADTMITDLGKLDEVVTIECQGDPRISIVKSAIVNINLEVNTFNKIKNITSVATSLSENGYVMNVTFDEFCPKFAGWSLAAVPTIFYAGTTRDGVYKSLDNGATWAAYNVGLTTGPKNVKSIAATEIDETMAIINGQLWYTTSSGLTITNPTWVRRYLPAPVNTSLDIPAPTNGGGLVTVTSAGTVGEFEVLTTITSGLLVGSGIGQYLPYESVYRGWVYKTIDSGLTWTSVQLESVDEEERHLFSFGGVHMSNRYGKPYVSANHGAEHWQGIWIYKMPIERTAYWIDYQTSPWKATRVTMPDRGYDLGFTYWDMIRDPVTFEPVVTVTGTPGNRQMTFDLLFPKQDNLANVNYEVGDPPILLNTLCWPLGFRYTLHPGDVIIDDYQSVPSYQTYGVYGPVGLVFGELIPPPQYANYYYVLRITAYESIIGSNAFWFRFSNFGNYKIRRYGSTLAEWYVYSGEPRIKDRDGGWYDEDYFPWEWWDLGSWSSRPNDEYPLYLNAGRIRFNFDEIQFKAEGG